MDFITICCTQWFVFLCKINTIDTKHFEWKQMNLYSLHYSSIDRSTVRRSISRYQTFDRLPFRWFNKSRDPDVSYVYLQYRRAVMALSKFSDCWMNTILSNLQTSNRWRQFWKKINVYSKSIIDWFLGQQFCLTLRRICCSQPTASGNIFVFGSNKSAVVREPSQ